MALGPRGSRFKGISQLPILNALGVQGGRFRSLGAFGILGSGQGRASASTAKGSNKDFTLTSKLTGLVGNNISYSVTTPGGANAVLGVTVTNPTPSTYLIAISTATSAGSVGTSTGNDIIAAVNASAAASAVVGASLKTGSNGTGVWLAADNIASTPLTGGSAALVGTA